MRIIIAGGSGLIGHALTKDLVEHGHQIIILSRNPGKVMGMPADVKIVKWDGTSLGSWAQEIENSDAVINLTGENLSGDGFLPKRWTRKRKSLLLRSRVDAGNILSNAIELSNRKPSIFVQASGIGFYGTQAEKFFNEDSPAGNDYFANLAKTWEASSQAVESLGVRRIIIRNGIVLSTKGGALPRLVLPYKLFIGGRLGSGKQVYSWIHIDDEVNAIRFLIEKSQTQGVYNLTAPNPTTNQEFGKSIGKVLKKPHYFPIPGFIMKLAFGEVSSVVLEGQTVIPKKLFDQGFLFKYPLISTALEDLFSHEK